MMDDRLAAIRRFEEKNIPALSPSDLPRFHVTGGVGWINDPNGFSVYKGEYHLFFQYYPYKTSWGLMHWGHVKTKDFIRWERLPAALAPDRDYDWDGCFSGSAVTLEDGRHLLMYTGVCNQRMADGRTAVIQTQCAAIGDGVNYEKYAGNPVISGEQLPEGGDIENFRDPGIWKDADGYHAVIGNRGPDGSGAVLLYDSRDALHWDCRGILAASHGQYGKMWECPDFFRLAGKDVLLVSLQDVSAADAGFPPGNASACLIGTYDPEKHCLDREGIFPIDHGIDFYAPQTLETPDGRRIMIAWMQNWETSSFVPEGQTFFGQMTLPRELSIRDGRLIQLPVRELDDYHGARIRYEKVMITSQASQVARTDQEAGTIRTARTTPATLPGIEGRFLDMTIRIRPADNTDRYKWFCLKVAQSEQYDTSIRYEPENSMLRVDRSHSGFPRDMTNVREFPVRNREGVLDLRIVMDRCSLEIFANEGEQAATFAIFTPESAAAISFACEGSLLMDIDKYVCSGVVFSNCGAYTIAKSISQLL